jgi:hypothetical protein
MTYANSTPMAPDPAITIEPGSSGVRICSSYVTTRLDSDVPGISRVVAPAAMMTSSPVTWEALPSEALTSIVFGPVNVPQPSISVILFFFIRKWTPLTMDSDT